MTTPTVPPKPKQAWNEALWLRTQGKFSAYLNSRHQLEQFYIDKDWGTADVNIGDKFGNARVSFCEDPAVGITVWHGEDGVSSGVLLSNERNAEIPEEFRNPDGDYSFRGGTALLNMVFREETGGSNLSESQIAQLLNEEYPEQFAAFIGDDDWHSEGTDHQNITADDRDGNPVTIFETRRSDLEDSQPAVPADPKARVDELIANRSALWEQLPKSVEGPFGEASLRLGTDGYDLVFDRGPFVVNGKDYSQETYGKLVSISADGRADNAVWHGSNDTVTASAKQKIADWVAGSGVTANIMSEKNVATLKLNGAVARAEGARRKVENQTAQLNQDREDLNRAHQEYIRLTGDDGPRKTRQQLRDTLPKKVEGPFGSASVQIGDGSFSLTFDEGAFTVNGKDYSQEAYGGNRVTVYRNGYVTSDAFGYTKPMTDSARKKVADWVFGQGVAADVMSAKNIATLSLAGRIATFDESLRKLDVAVGAVTEAEMEAIEVADVYSKAA